MVHSYSRFGLGESTTKVASSPQSISKSSGIFSTILSGTKTSTVLTVLHGWLPAISVIVTEYVVVTPGSAIGVGDVGSSKPAAGDHS